MMFNLANTDIRPLVRKQAKHITEIPIQANQGLDLLEFTETQTLVFTTSSITGICTCVELLLKLKATRS